MQMKLENRILIQLTELIEEAPKFAPTIESQKNNFGQMTDGKFDHERYTIWNTRCLNLLNRIEDGKSIHLKKFLNEEEKSRKYHSISINVFYKVAILKALKIDIETGNFFNQSLLLSADVFGDILEQAKHLLSENYKDAAAVMIRAVLESTLRKLCEKHQLQFSPKDTIHPLNNLLKDKAYNQIIHKQIITWADLRNKAAHGEFSEYDINQVSDMMKWVEEFVSSNLQ